MTQPTESSSQPTASIGVPASVLLCPGQGAQALGMGLKWRDASAAAAKVFERADQIVGSRLGAPLSRICFEGPEATLNRTDIAQPALFVAGVACWHGLKEAGVIDRVVAVAGLSLGEYTALHLAGAFSFEDGLELVLLRGRAMQDAAEAVPSGMVALVGADEASAAAVCEKAAQGDVLVPANFNAPGQVVISGAASACDRAVAAASELGLRATKLAVAGAFHSPLMAPAADRLAQRLAQTAVGSPGTLVLSNVTGSAHEADPESIRGRLVEQLTRPVLWSQCCTWLAANASGEFRELAPGKVLAGLMKRIDRTRKVTSHDEPA